MANTTQTENLNKLSKSALIALIAKAVQAGNYFEQQFCSPKEGLAGVYAKDLDDLTQITFDGLAVDSEFGAQCLEHLEQDPITSLDAVPSRGIPVFTENALQAILRFQSNLTSADFDKMGIGSRSGNFQRFAQGNWNLVSYMFNQASQEERLIIINRLNESTNV